MEGNTVLFQIKWTGDRPSFSSTSFKAELESTDCLWEYFHLSLIPIFYFHINEAIFLILPITLFLTTFRLTPFSSLIHTDGFLEKNAWL